MGKSTDKSSLGDRMKNYEAQTEQRIPYNEYIIVRIDGHKFSKFTKGFDRPIDNLLRETLAQTSEALLKEFNACTAYTQSDEITLVIAPQFYEETEPVDFPNVQDGDICICKETNKKSYIEIENIYSDREDKTDVIYFDDESFEVHEIYGHPIRYNEEEIQKINQKYKFYRLQYVDNNQIYSGRVQKLCSLIAAFATMSFNKFFNENLKNIKDPKEIYIKRYNSAWFDARVFGLEDKDEVFNSVMWRVRDCVKNAKNMYAQTYCSHKSLLNLNGKEQVQYCLEQTGNEFNNTPDSFKYGTFIKREKYTKPISNIPKGIAPKEDKVIRTKLVRISKPMTSYNSDDVTFIITKELNERIEND